MLALLAISVGLCMTITPASGRVGSLSDVPVPNRGLDSAWMRYVKDFNKTYSDASEQAYRRSVWEDNLVTIVQHNKEFGLGLHTYTMAVNHLTDLTADEFSTYYLAPSRPVSYRDDDVTVGVNVMNSYDVVDWRQRGVVTPVKNQGACGSCWAFSTTGSIESQHAIKYRKLVSLSEQMLMDCCTQGNHGCHGGLVEKAIQCVQQKHGIDTEYSYPYYAKQSAYCKFKSYDIAAKVTGYKSGQGQSYLHAVVNQVGPASVYIFATSKLQHYQGGVFSDPDCQSKSINHAVLVVGYGDGYWLVKNSWGTRWGMDGYFKMKRDTSVRGMCNIGYDIIYPTM